MAKKQQKRTRTRRIADKQGMVSCPMKDEKVNTSDTCDECEHEMNRQGRIVNCGYMEDEEEE
jgi:hypothetical protein